MHSRAHLSRLVPKCKIPLLQRVYHLEVRWVPPCYLVTELSTVSENPWAATLSTIPSKPLAPQPSAHRPARVVSPAPRPVPTPSPRLPPPPAEDNWGTFGDDGVDESTSTPFDSPTAAPSMAAMSKEEKAAEMARRRDERKQVSSMCQNHTSSH